MKGKTIRGEHLINDLGGISKNVAAKSTEFTLHFPSFFDYRYTSNQRDEIIQVL